MKKALGGLFTRPYQSREAHGTVWGPWSVFTGAVSISPPAISQDGVRPRPPLPHPQPRVPPLQQTLSVETVLQVQVQRQAWPRSGLATGSSVGPSVGVFCSGLMISASCPCIKQG